jgi:hypothetical protein
MARKTNTSNPATLPSKSDLGLSDLRVRLNFLEKENDKLIKQIESSRTKSVFEKLSEPFEEDLNHAHIEKSLRSLR